MKRARRSTGTSSRKGAKDSTSTPSARARPQRHTWASVARDSGFSPYNTTLYDGNIVHGAQNSSVSLDSGGSDGPGDLSLAASDEDVSSLEAPVRRAGRPRKQPAFGRRPRAPSGPQHKGAGAVLVQQRQRSRQRAAAVRRAALTWSSEEDEEEDEEYVSDEAESEPGARGTLRASVGRRALAARGGRASLPASHRSNPERGTISNALYRGRRPLRQHSSSDEDSEDEEAEDDDDEDEDSVQEKDDVEAVNGDRAADKVGVKATATAADKVGATATAKAADKIGVKATAKAADKRPEKTRLKNRDDDEYVDDDEDDDEDEDEDDDDSEDRASWMSAREAASEEGPRRGQAGRANARRAGLRTHVRSSGQAAGAAQRNQAARSTVVGGDATPRRGRQLRSQNASLRAGPSAAAAAATHVKVEVDALKASPPSSAQAPSKRLPAARVTRGARNALARASCSSAHQAHSEQAAVRETGTAGEAAERDDGGTGTHMDSISTPLPAAVQPPVCTAHPRVPSVGAVQGSANARAHDEWIAEHATSSSDTRALSAASHLMTAVLASRMEGRAAAVAAQVLNSSLRVLRVALLDVSGQSERARSTVAEAALDACSADGATRMRGRERTALCEQAAVVFVRTLSPLGDLLDSADAAAHIQHLHSCLSARCKGRGSTCLSLFTALQQVLASNSARTMLRSWLASVLRLQLQLASEARLQPDALRFGTAGDHTATEPLGSQDLSSLWQQEGVSQSASLAVADVVASVAHLLQADDVSALIEASHTATMAWHAAA